MNQKTDLFDLIVIGGGAAGFFGAIQVAELKAGLRIVILEKSNKLLRKVKISGGGRCNVTHHCYNPVELAHHYPRGEKQLMEIFKSFHAKHAVDWFASKGVEIKAEEDGRMFPVTDSSQTIIDCFMKEAFKHQIKIELGVGIEGVQQQEEFLSVSCTGGKSFKGKCILIAVGGNPNVQFYEWIRKLGHTIIPPIPSLFTFNDSQKHFKDLMGISVPNGEVRIAGTRYLEKGPILITHWGLSGPAVIKLSAWAAAYLHEQKYDFTAWVSWIGNMKEEALREFLHDQKKLRVKQKIFSNPLFGLPLRLWERLCFLSEINDTKIWGEVKNRNLNKLIEFLIRCPFRMKGKTTFKEEFVTCGGVDLKEVNLQTMESKMVKDVFFAGEVLNIDGETGGFNFQAAWSTAYAAARGIAQK